MKKISSLILIICALTSCVAATKDSLSLLPDWYVSPKANDGASLYGIGEGYTMEEATKSALADLAARLIVSISSESTLLREENQNAANEEMRQKIQQNIEKIDFVNFSISRSVNLQSKIYAEVKINREQFINAQKEKMQFLDKKTFNLKQNISSQNLIQKRNSLVQISALLKQSELLARIVQASGENANVKDRLSDLADAQNQLDKLNDKVEFYFEITLEKEIFAIIQNALNKERIAVAKVKNSNPNQVQIKIDSFRQVNQIYGSYITKIKINFENKVEKKIIASNSIEVSGSSTINEKESYFSALESLKERVVSEGILKILGII